MFKCFVYDSLVAWQSKVPEDPQKEERFINILEVERGYYQFRNLTFNTPSEPKLFLAYTQWDIHFVNENKN